MMPERERGTLRAFHLLEHLEHALGRVYKEAFESLAQTTTLQSIAAGPFNFCHSDLFLLCDEAWPSSRPSKTR